MRPERMAVLEAESVGRAGSLGRVKKPPPEKAEPSRARMPKYGAERVMFLEPTGLTKVRDPEKRPVFRAAVKEARDGLLPTIKPVKTLPGNVLMEMVSSRGGVAGVMEAAIPPSKNWRLPKEELGGRGLIRSAKEVGGV